MTLPNNRDYQFVSRNFELFQDYFNYPGWHLERDDDFGVISIANTMEHNRLRLDRFTTLFLYVCHVIYEEGMADMDSFKYVETTTNKAVIEKMATYELPDKKKDKTSSSGRTGKRESTSGASSRISTALKSSTIPPGTVTATGSLSCRLSQTRVSTPCTQNWRGDCCR